MISPRAGLAATDRVAAWRDVVRRHLPDLGLRPERQVEVEDELADLLADFAAETGVDPTDAAAVDGWLAREVPDWPGLARRVAGDERRRARRTAAAPRPPASPTASRFDLETLLMNLLRELRYALRVLGRRPGFTLTAALTLALGVGLDAAVFSLVNALLLRPLPVESPAELVQVYGSGVEELRYTPLSVPEARDLGERMDSFSGVALYAQTNVAVDGREGVRSALAETVSGEYFDVLGIDAAIGRLFGPAEDGPGGGEPVAVLAHDTWLREWGGDPAAVGATVRINGQPFTVVGIAPRGFRGLLRGLSPELWVPLETTARLQVSGFVQLGERTAGLPLLEDRARRWVWAVGRLAPGATLAAATAEAEALAPRLAELRPPSPLPVGLRLLAADEVILLPDFDGTVRDASWAILAIVSLVLVIASANLANMLLARAVGRRKEMATRLSLGAGRAQLVRQLLIESLALAVLGGAGGLVLGRLAVGAFASLPLPLPIPLELDLGLDHRVFLFAFGVAALAAVVFGLAPALRATRSDLATTLREEGASAAGRSRNRLAGALVVAQVATSLLLLVAAGLSLRGLQRAERIDPGFRVDGAIVASLSPRLAGYERPATEQFYTELEERLAGLPGVTAVTSADRLPLGVEINVERLAPAERAGTPREEWAQIDSAAVSAGYFSTLGSPLVAGREIARSDTAETQPVVVINETLARRFWPTGDAVGRSLVFEDEETPRTVIGVVADGKYRTLGETPRAFVWTPLAQDYASYRTMVVRTSDDPGRALAALRQVVGELDERMVIDRLATLEDAVGTALLVPRMAAAMLGLFGLLGLTLATVGLYGVVAYAVSLRLREMGIRMAMGADRGSVLRLVVGDGLRLALLGVVLGLVAAVAATPLLGDLLYGLSASDPLTFGAVAAFLVAVAALASAIPAWRAARVDPIEALRHE